ncbi:G-alpha-domain-containing protein [Rhizoclosmatium globosum]|uniref:G-alpha-domain-containing protein n=1 Tax=Rhizoclosmatium globosum TaxID=329046 RepID=A0A1Y2CXA1_9FUNG|nr:G-alpha-domain-containing protein [Rhizoclosmatium globosum]|eukprot:ORY51668.1 G-alpha-domain-containing protein [Rhizoclosmatium globosum]
MQSSFFGQILAYSTAIQGRMNIICLIAAPYRICVPDYVPTDQDILHSRITTTTITETRVQIEKMMFRIFDVGGQRSERKKWAPYFDDVNAIIYLAAISSYDQMCEEDNATNRMTEALNLFSSIVNHPFSRQLRLFCSSTRLTCSSLSFLNRLFPYISPSIKV